jgi:hypothetical protein
MGPFLSRAMCDPRSVADLELLVARCEGELGPPASWPVPDGYRDSLALCILDAVWSIGVRYRSVENVVDTYRRLREQDGALPNLDDAAALVDLIERLGGPAAFADAVGNRQRTSTCNGVLKAEAVSLAAQALVAAVVDAAWQLREADSDQLGRAKSQWRRVPGQRSGVSWRYLLLLTGRQEVKPDPMIMGFVSAARARPTTAAVAADLVLAAADRMGVEPRVLDHRIWRYQSGRG